MKHGLKPDGSCVCGDTGCDGPPCARDGSEQFGLLLLPVPANFEGLALLFFCDKDCDFCFLFKDAKEADYVEIAC